MSGYDKAYFEQINTEESPQAERLADVLIWKYNPRSVIDIGCATGLYLKPFMDRGIKIIGIDNAEDAVGDEVLKIPRKKILLRDITRQPIGKRSNLAISLEVLEHISERGASLAVKHITQTADTIIFSAAQPGQGGVGHVNCQPKEYWEKRFKRNSFRRDEADELYLKTIMASGYHMGWLINNMMVFKKAKLS